MVAVDPAKVQNSRSEIQREWVQRVFSFNSVWDNGKVFLWRPVVPTIPARFLQHKRYIGDLPNKVSPNGRGRVFANGVSPFSNSLSEEPRLCSSRCTPCQRLPNDRGGV